VTLVIVLAISYLLGAIPTSYIVVHRLTGRDIRDLGDGNPGMMNVWDSVGLPAALVVGFGDIGKGMVAVTLASMADVHEAAPMLAGLIAIIGHDYSIFLRLDGGNGMATAVGAISALAPLAAVPAVAVAVAVWLLSGSRRLGGIAGLMLVPVLAYISTSDPQIVSGIVLLMTLAALKIISFEGFTPARSRLDR
jgi:acyl phosphate:glycerol-3-phosphate acyltransferase